MSYDLPVDFYRLWLDEGMSYSCALFEGDCSLEEAQTRKLDWIADAAGVEPGSRVLDVGCGWGAALDHLSRRRDVAQAVGITLSPSQYAEVLRRDIPKVEVECVSYADYSPAEPFDAVISIGMFEHLATPEQARTGEHVAVYREYFRKLREWTKPGARFGLQSVIGARMPRKKEELRELAWGTYGIFPGAISPRIEAIAAAVTPHWEILELRTRRLHYAQTSAEWLARLKQHESTISERWGAERFAEYARYLAACQMVFEKGYQSLAQLSLQRID